MINVFCKAVKQHPSSHWSTPVCCAPAHDSQALVSGCSADLGAHSSVSAGWEPQKRQAGNQEEQHLCSGSSLKKLSVPKFRSQRSPGPSTYRPFPILETCLVFHFSGLQNGLLAMSPTPLSFPRQPLCLLAPGSGAGLSTW